MPHARRLLGWTRGTFVLIKGTSKLKVMICRNIFASPRVSPSLPRPLFLSRSASSREMEPLRCLMPHLLAVRIRPCSCGPCLQRSIYIKRKDILSTLLTRRTGYRRLFRGEMAAGRFCNTSFHFGDIIYIYIYMFGG